MRSLTSPIILGVGLVPASAMGANGIAIGILAGDASFFVLSWLELRKLASRSYVSASTGPFELQPILEVVPDPEGST